MKLSYLVAGALLLLGALMANAFTIYTTVDAMHTSGTVVELYAYSSKPASFSVEAQYTNAMVENLGDHAKIRLIAPDCLKGTEAITIRATDGYTKQEKTVTLEHQPRKECTSYTQTQPTVPALYIPKTTILSSDYTPTSYDFQIDSPKSCIRMAVGEVRTYRVRVLNNGAATTVRLRAVDEDGTNTVLEGAEFNADRNQLITTNARIHALKAGTHYIDIEALRGDVVVGRASACVAVEDTYHAILKAPGSVEAMQCGLTEIPVELRNDGTAPQVFTVGGQNIQPVTISLEKGQSAKLNLLLNASTLHANENTILIQAEGDGTLGAAYLVANVRLCGPQVTTQPPAFEAEALNWTIVVGNEKDTPLKNVTLLISGLPAAWRQKSDSVDIPPHGSAKLKATVERTTDEAANPVIHVLADGKEIAAYNAVPIAERPSFTGRLIESIGGGWTLLTVLLLFLAAGLLMLAHGQYDAISSGYNDAKAANKEKAKAAAAEAAKKAANGSRQASLPSNGANPA